MFEAGSRRLVRRTLLACGIMLFAAGMPANAAILIQNPGFEDGLSGWTQTGVYQSADTTVAHTGTTSVKLLKQAYGGALYTEVPGAFGAGTLVELGLWMLMPNPGTHDCKWFSTYLYPTGHPELAVAIEQFDAVPAWTYKTVSLELPAATTSIRIDIKTENGNGFGDLGAVWVDDVSMTATPEPATLSLLALGGLGVIGRRARRKRR